MRRLVLKPAILGVETSMSLAREARRRGKPVDQHPAFSGSRTRPSPAQVVLSSCFESGVGLCHIAACVPRMASSAHIESLEQDGFGSFFRCRCRSVDCREN